MWYIGNNFLVMTTNEYFLTLLLVYMAMCLLISGVLIIMNKNSTNERKAWKFNLDYAEFERINQLEKSFWEYQQKQKKPILSWGKKE